MRNMSFALTTEQARNKTKTVTRRFGWWFLKPGDRVQMVEKAMGLKKGEKVKKIHVIEVVSTKSEYVCDIFNYPQEELAKEGFPNMTKWEFVDLLTKGKRRDRAYDLVNRIEFKYVEVE